MNVQGASSGSAEEDAGVDRSSSDTPQGDTRSTTLRMAHTLVDALLATAIIVVWQRLYGAEETGWMSALLRVLGFLPAVVHMAWAQVALAQSRHPTKTAWANPLWIGLGAFACVIVLGLSCAVALYQGWLDPRWHGVWPYIAPLVLWQGCACLSAAFSHRPFQTHNAHYYSWFCMLISALQAIVLFFPIFYSQEFSAPVHISSLALVSTAGLLGLTAWTSKLTK